MQMDEYELELLDAIEGAPKLERVDNFEDELFEAKIAAKNYLNKTKNINIRIPQYDMMMLKRKSAQLNIPYQTILSSLIHQYVSGKIKPSL